MTGRVLLQAVKIVGITVPVTLAWLKWGRAAYGRLLADLVIPIFGIFVLTIILPQGSRERVVS